MHGEIFIVSAPSGAGKTSLLTALTERVDNVVLSVSSTTRPIRPGETDGVDYHFMDEAEFEQHVEQGEFLEHATVFGYHYGTSRASVLDQIDQGLDVILEIDWQGARQVRQKIEDVTGIFILPPSVAALEQRLHGRAQDSETVIQRRLAEAQGEIAHYDEFDYVIINDDFDQALEDLLAILRSHGLKRSTQTMHHTHLISQLLGT